MKTRKARQPPTPKQPTPDTLHNAALAHLARYAATESGLLRVLDRRIQRWAHAASETERDHSLTLTQEARRIVARLAASGAVSDTAFAAARSKTLQRAGKSTRAIGAHLTARGVAPDLAHNARPQTQAEEYPAAAIHLRRRRHGPFRTTEDTPDQRRRELAALARAGFSQETARAALRLGREEAEALIAAFRADL